MQHGIEGSEHYNSLTLKVGASAKHFSNYGIENYGNFVSAAKDPINGDPASTPKYPQPQGFKPQPR